MLVLPRAGCPYLSRFLDQAFGLTRMPSARSAFYFMTALLMIASLVMGWVLVLSWDGCPSLWRFLDQAFGLTRGPAAFWAFFF